MVDGLCAGLSTPVAIIDGHTSSFDCQMAMIFHQDFGRVSHLFAAEVPVRLQAC
jgi:hypothetical protein